MKKQPAKLITSEEVAAEVYQYNAHVNAGREDAARACLASIVDYLTSKRTGQRYLRTKHGYLVGPDAFNGGAAQAPPKLQPISEIGYGDQQG